jgi:hypothetical protein
LKNKSPRAATLLAIIPGLGAAYNGQNIKALMHFAVTVGLWHLADIFEQPFSPLFVTGGVAFYLFTIYDARQSAERQREGEDLRREDELLRQSLRRRARAWGGVLLGVGVVSFLHIFFDAPIHGLWPLLLIAAGVYLLRGFRQLSGSEPAVASHKPAPPSVIVTPYDYDAEDEHFRNARRFDQGR